jgi:hypothetical protein
LLLLLCILPVGRISLSLDSTMKMTVIWDIAPWSLVEVDGRFRASAITGRLKDSIPEGCHLHTSFILAGISLDFHKLSLSRSSHWSFRKRLVSAYFVLCLSYLRWNQPVILSLI